MAYPVFGHGAFEALFQRLLPYDITEFHILSAGEKYQTKVSVFREIEIMAGLLVSGGYTLLISLVLPADIIEFDRDFFFKSNSMEANKFQEEFIHVDMKV